jgi:phage FluMu protein Com
MKAQLKVRPNLTLELEADQQTDLFRLLASAQEVFGEQKCGKCKCANLLFRTRKNAQDNEFFELICTHCRAVLQLGAHKKGNTLFPRRHRDGDGGEKEWLPDNGWLRWDAESERMV